MNGFRSAIIELDRRSKQRGDEEGCLTIPRHRHYDLQPSASENMGFSVSTLHSATAFWTPVAARG